MMLYVFGWPGSIGGASTKLHHLLRLLRHEYQITVVPYERCNWEQDPWARELSGLGIHYCHFSDLPERLDGWGLSLCHGEFLNSSCWQEVRRRGVKMAWSNEMTWNFPQELGAIALGEIDAVLYVSPTQRAFLEPEYRRALTGRLTLPPSTVPPEETAGWITTDDGSRRLRWVMTGNYIDPDLFPFRPATSLWNGQRPLSVGRLSRPDPSKFPRDFPESYTRLGLENTRFRVMGWSEQLEKQWSRDRFRGDWEFLEPLAESASQFLQSLDVMVYQVGEGCRESWGRVVVESMLSGTVPIVPKGGGHHLDQLVRDGIAGFSCADSNEFEEKVRWLRADPTRIATMAESCRDWAVQQHCNPISHRAIWKRLFLDVD
jgi:glycosyltransferase involved in cell wall biosynthesis